MWQHFYSAIELSGQLFVGKLLVLSFFAILALLLLFVCFVLFAQFMLLCFSFYPQQSCSDYLCSKSDSICSVNNIKKPKKPLNIRKVVKSGELQMYHFVLMLI